MHLRTPLLVLLLACGGSSPGEPADDTTTGGEADGPCPAELGECYDEGARAACLEVAETCPADQILVLESCPVQYSCGAEDGSEPGPDADEPVASDVCEGYRATDSCMNEDNFAACQQVSAQCPGAVAVMESCPLQFACE